MEPMIKAGLPHKVCIGRPYEEAADLLDDAHYVQCAAAVRPPSSDRFRPSEASALAASTAIGAGYDRDEALQAIRERYDVATETLRYTFPRLLAEESGRAMITRLRQAGWLDWQILVVLVNTVWNWRMSSAGIRPDISDREEMVRLAREPETPRSPAIPIGAFAADAIDMHTYMQTVTLARRWELRGRQEEAGEEAMRDLLTRRYRYADDDVPHRDLLDSVDRDGHLIPFLDEGANSG